MLHFLVAESRASAISFFVHVGDCTCGGASPERTIRAVTSEQPVVQIAKPGFLREGVMGILDESRRGTR